MPLVYPVSSGKVKALEDKMRRLGLSESDFEETFVRSGGAGGQHVNKVSTCVVVKHLPSGLTARCQRERSQALNRFLAMRDLVDRIEEVRLGHESRRRSEIEKLRRQKRKRSKRAKEKMLAGKKMRSEKKRLRGKISERE